ncbi:TM0106 family RecB-like putative nuclease [Granulosicoccus antarcticus]|uniref:RecBCD enzyme subunit RecD n=1 Tax=Granulosicoccus antarcticus IMCC3135 TaxID=1192854 RepID=A0A2Z2NHY5_9GAMM|nr:TM0106 family RecB-like putative nuclease [Granulosicoccus antarcticus]ASJ70916.1 hypothetical protein IMCC3135_04015 [Granulosicoccus antarcticus IMCC3135]
MRILNNRLVFSPSDLSGYLSSPFASWMDRFAREFPDQAPPADEADALLGVLGKRGLEHEAAFEQRFRDAGLEVLNIDAEVCATTESLSLSAEEDMDRRRLCTVEAIRSGVDVIAQATLEGERFAGVADFLVKVPGASELGSYHYEVWDTKLASRIRPGFVIQLCCYVEMLEQIQGCRAEHLVVVLGDRREERVRLVDCQDYYRALKQQFLQLHDGWSRDEMPSPTASSSYGRWSGYVQSWLESIDHLSQVATITGSQLARLEAAGIATRAALAAVDVSVAGIDDMSLQRLARQASLQIQSQGCAVPAYSLLEQPVDIAAADAREVLLSVGESGVTNGLSRLPAWCPEDVFFDIEGFPLDTGGLEYLWGCTYFDEQSERTFRDWWAHDSTAERQAFEGFIDWIYERWQRAPTMHVYHYANYEIAACQRLMGRYGTREHELDELLRADVFVDLYVVVQQSLQIGEPRYSIKNVERLYRGGRDTDVGSGGDSVVVYEHWRERHQAGVEGDTWQNSETLNSIRNYNIDDCNSTQELVDWLRERQQEHGITIQLETGDSQEVIPDQVVSARLEMRDRLLLNADTQRKAEDYMTAAVSENMAGLLEFHRREAKPAWWRYFDRHSSTPEQLMHDPACLAKCLRTGREPFKPTERARNLAYEYDFGTMQDFKGLPAAVELLDERGDNDKPLRATVLHALSDFAQGRLVLQSAKELPTTVTLIPNEFINPAPIPDAIDAVVEQWLERSDETGSIDDFLFRRAPRFKQPRPGAIAYGDTSEERLAATIEAVLDLDDSYLTIQGPPGCGKSYTGARIIAALCAQGCKIGISSNSHAAIQNLMTGAARYCQAQGVAARFLCSRQPDDELVQLGAELFSNSKLAAELAPATVVGTTAWGFARNDLAGEFDYLLIDEAGQVSVANLLAMSRSARNLVLLGDQMQLGQPSQGSHPAESGLSVLEYLLKGQPTIDENMGVFLGTTYRMHSHINRYVSQRFYDGRLKSVAQTDARELLPDEARLPELDRKAGICFIPVQHTGNAQSSEEEAVEIFRLARSLLGQRVKTSASDDSSKPLGWNDLLFVAPYNQQVKLLQERLGEQARVGSVDRFQGQEAAVVFLSLCSSDAAEAPRGIDFLFDPNRLNVAISRAQTLVVVVGNPGLATTRVSTVAQLRKVNLVAGLLYHSADE